MSNIIKFEQYPFDVKHHTDDLSTVTFVIPTLEIKQFVLMLSSLANLFAALGWKAKTNIEAIHHRLEKTSDARNRYAQEFEEYVCQVFTEYLRSGKSSKESLSLTLNTVKNKYEFSSYDIIRNCLQKNKYLKKTGFYKSRHKFV